MVVWEVYGFTCYAEVLDRVFKVPITTVKCISHGCRLAFSQALKTVLCKVVAQPDSIDAWVSHWLCGGKDDGITMLVKSILDGSRIWGLLARVEVDFLRTEADGATPHQEMSSQGCGWTLYSHSKSVILLRCLLHTVDVVLKPWSAKTSFKPPPSLPSITSSKRAPLDGLRAQHILDALCGEGSATATDLLKGCYEGVGKEMSKYLSDFQFGVGVSGGAEAILHSVNRVLSEYHNDGSLAMLTVDFSNAFNLVDRSALLHEVSGPGLGIELNIKKTEIFWPSCNGMKLRKGLFPVDIRRPSSGVKLLGGAVSRDADFISGLAMRRASNVVDLMGLLPQLHDPQSELLLLRSCMASRAQSWVLQDHILRDSGICGMDDDYVSALACLRDTIPSFDFSGFTNKDTVPSKAQQTLANVLFSEMVKDMEVHFDMTMRQKAIFMSIYVHTCSGDFTCIYPLRRALVNIFITVNIALSLSIVS
ncbi:hypothetical protein Tco_0770028 [Tanacetum coccineum]|uniref:Reverse transcriptase domain-containing protein n=1 Tax=Tanacetum coccineum TaxID=301880 RepID=A0ABQ4ZC21_9ASTR